MNRNELIKEIVNRHLNECADKITKEFIEYLNGHEWE